VQLWQVVSPLTRKPAASIHYVLQHRTNASSPFELTILITPLGNAPIAMGRDAVSAGPSERNDPPIPVEVIDWSAGAAPILVVLPNGLGWIRIKIPADRIVRHQWPDGKIKTNLIAVSVCAVAPPLGRCEPHLQSVALFDE
jgi:hypothetical protein